MHAGSLFNEITGSEGSITVPGLGSVVATFQSWKLTRQGKKKDKVIWMLRGTCSYMNEPMLKSLLVKKKISLTVGKKNTILLCSWTEMNITGSNIELKGVEQCL